MKVYQRLLNVLLIALLLGALSVTFGQTITTGDVAGTVKDTTGAVVPGATVTIKSSTGDNRTQTTDNAGNYRFTFLKPGDYVLSATAAGLKTDVTKLEVQVGQAVTVDLVAKVQATQEVVEVLASAALVETENANLSSTYSTKQVNELPAPGGDITSIAFTAPGITVSTGSGYGNFSSHGLPGVSNLFTVNGNDYNDAYLNLNNSGASNLLLGSNEIQEVAVVQNAYSVQYGREAGAQINYTTKSGTNGFHGDLNYNWNGDRLNANDFFANTNGLARSKAVSNQYSADFGGRIIKDKLFFYADTEGLRYTLPTAGVVAFPSPQLETYTLGQIQPAQQALYQNAFSIWNNAPGASHAVPITNGNGQLQDANGNLGCGVTGFAGTPAPGGGTFGVDVPCGLAYAQSGSNTNTEWLLTSRVDYSISDKQKINFRVKVDRGFQPTGTNLINTTFNEQSIQPQDEGQVNYTYVISPTVVNNFIGSVLWYSAYFGPADTAKSLAAFPTFFRLYDGGTNAANFYSMGSDWRSFPQGRNVGQGQLIDDISIIKGHHTLKLGENFRRNRVTDDGLLPFTHGAYLFGSLADFATGVTNPANGSAYEQSFTPITAAHIRLYNIGVYAQDEWAAAKNVKVLFGIRFDRTGNPQCLDKCFSNLTSQFGSAGFQTGIDIPYNQSINTGLSSAYGSVDQVVPQPRVGVVWSPRGANSMVIRGGFGIFADLAPAFLVSNIFTNPPAPFFAYVSNGSTVDVASDPNSAAASAQSQYGAFKTGFFGGQTLAQLNASVPGGFGPINFYSAQNHFGTPKYAEWSFEVEQPLGPKNVFVLTYAGNHGYSLLTTNGFVNAFDANTAQFPTFAGLPSAPLDGRFLAVTNLNNNGKSNYDGLTVQYRRAFSYGFQGQVSYTWSHSLDNLSNGGSGLPYTFTANTVTTLLNGNLAQNYGNSDYDIRHNVVGDFVWDTPWKFNHKALTYLLSNWTISGKFYLRTGVPETITDSLLAGQVSGGSIGGGGAITATALSPIPGGCDRSAVNTACLSSSSFVAQGAETGFGNIGRNSLFGPGYFNIDTTVYKNITITERMKFVIGASAYNVLNHPHFADPVADIANPGLGLIQSTVSSPTSAYGGFQGSLVSGRQLVLTGKFMF